MSFISDLIMNFNFTSQICTTEEQSKRLLDLGLKSETADMSYRINCFDFDGMLLECIHTLEPDPPLNNDKFIPAWSLHRLIEMLPPGYREQIRVGTTDNSYEYMYQVIGRLVYVGEFNKKYLEE